MEHGRPVDDEIVRWVREGKSGAFGELVDRHIERLYAFARSRVGSETAASDLTQDTFEEAYLSLDRYEEGTDFAAWLRAICRNLVRNHFRSLSRRREVPLRLTLIEIENPAPPVDLPLERLSRCMEELDDVARFAVEGFYRESRPLAAIAGALKKHVSAVTVALHRARYRLRDCLKRAGVEGLAP